MFYCVLIATPSNIIKSFLNLEAIFVFYFRCYIFRKSTVLICGHERNLWAKLKNASLPGMLRVLSALSKVDTVSLTSLSLH